MESQLNDKNKIKAARTWAVSLKRYELRTIKWNEEELQKIDRNSRKNRNIKRGALVKALTGLKKRDGIVITKPDKG